MPYPNTKHLFKSAANAFNQNNYADATDYCSAVLSQSPQFADSYHLLGVIAFKTGSPHKALALVRKACELAPEKSIFHNSLGNILSEEGHIEEAIFEYETASKLAPDFIDPHINGALAMSESGDFNKAIELLDNALKRNNSEERILFAKANLLRKHAQFSESESIYLTILSNNPLHEAAVINLGVIYTDADRHEEAKTLYAHAIDSGLISANIIFNLGYIFQQQKDFNSAKECYQKVIKLDDSFDKATANLGTIYFEEGEFGDAIFLLAQLAPDSTSFFDAKHNLIMCLQATQQMELMHNTIQQCLKNNNVDESLSIKLGIHLAIFYWLSADIPSCRATLLSLDKLIDTRKKLDSFALGYHSYLHTLVDTYNQQHYSPLATETTAIYAVGDSHSLALANLQFENNDTRYVVSTKLVAGAKAWHLANDMQNKFKSSFECSIKNIPTGSSLLLLFGEIDCRVDEGIIIQLDKKDRDMESVIVTMVNGYLDFVRKKSAKRELKIIICGVPAIYRKRASADQEKYKQLQSIIKFFNTTLMKRSNEYGFQVIDSYANTADEQNLSSGKDHIDHLHLSPNYWLKVLEKAEIN